MFLKNFTYIENYFQKSNIFRNIYMYIIYMYMHGKCINCMKTDGTFSEFKLISKPSLVDDSSECSSCLLLFIIIFGFQEETSGIVSDRERG